MSQKKKDRMFNGKYKLKDYLVICEIEKYLDEYKDKFLCNLSEYGFVVFDTSMMDAAIFWFGVDENDRIYFGYREEFSSNAPCKYIYDDIFNNGFNIIKRVVEEKYYNELLMTND